MPARAPALRSLPRLGPALVDGARPAPGDRGPRGWGDPGRSPTAPAVAAADRSPRPPRLRPRRRHLRGRLGRQEPGPDRGRPSGGKSGCGPAGYRPDLVAQRAVSRLSLRGWISRLDRHRDRHHQRSRTATYGRVIPRRVAGCVAWSPDSTRVATWVDWDDRTIGVYGLDGTREALLTLPAGYVGTWRDDDAHWSPDGGSLLISLTPGSRGGPPPDLGAAGRRSDATRRLPAGDPRSHWDATCSADGARVAYVRILDSGSLVVADAAMVPRFGDAGRSETRSDSQSGREGHHTEIPRMVTEAVIGSLSSGVTLPRADSPGTADQDCSASASSAWSTWRLEQ